MRCAGACEQAVAETKRMSRQLTNVLQSPITAKHLIISLGAHALRML
jgi:hypothetical protein